jgi:DNA-binding CsgD family transcriptional regulator
VEVERVTQRRVAKLVLRACTTGQIVIDLHISPHTLQDHLKVVFVAPSTRAPSWGE